MLKLTKLLIALSLLLTFAACGDDESPESNELSGTWKAVSFDAEVESTTTFGGTTTNSTSTIVGTSLDYEVTFDDPNFTTSGGYSYTVETMVTGFPSQSSTESVSNVSGTGTYSVAGNVMTINGSFFELEFNGMTLTEMSGTQMTDFEINSAGQLVFSQDEEMTTEDSGVTSTSHIVSNSVWEKQ